MLHSLLVCLDCFSFPGYYWSWIFVNMVLEKSWNFDGPVVYEPCRSLSRSTIQQASQGGTGAPKMVYINLLHSWVHGNKLEEILMVRGLKKIPENQKGTRLAIRSQFPVQKRPSVKSPILKPQFHKNIPMNNHDLLQWCR